MSQSSSANSKKFFVNVGCSFDEVCGLNGIEINEKPKEYECDATGFRDRLEYFVKEASDVWLVSPDSHDDAFDALLFECLSRVVTSLSAINSVAAYRQHAWFDNQSPQVLRAQAFYLLGDHAAARSEVQRLAKTFADRANANEPSYWIEQLHFSELEET